MTPSPDAGRFRFELITEAHNVSDFGCENQWLTKFLLDEALNETENDLSRTYLLIDTEETTKGQIAGYFTLHADSIYAERPNGQGMFLYPLIYILALARDIRRKGEGMGDVLLLEAFRCTMKAAEIVGVAGIHLDTTLQGQRLYAEYGFDQHPEGGKKRLISIDDVRDNVRSLQPPETF